MILFTAYYWRSSSRKLFRFHICKPDEVLPEEGGIYIFVRCRLLFFRKPLYVGKAASLKSRLGSHERWEEGRKRGANERHILCVKSEEDRRRIEEDLIRHLKPKLNNMLVPHDGDHAPSNKKLKRGWISASDYWSLNDPATRRRRRQRKTDEYWSKGSKAA